MKLQYTNPSDDPTASPLLPLKRFPSSSIDSGQYTHDPDEAGKELNDPYQISPGDLDHGGSVRTDIDYSGSDR